MFIASVRVALISTALLVSTAVSAFGQATPAAATSTPMPRTDVNIGISHLGDNGGWGVQGALASRIKPLSEGKMLSWIADVSFHHYANDLFDSNVDTFLVQGGIRISGPLTEQVDWYAHGMMGVARSTLGGDLSDVCDTTDEVDCEETDFVFTPGAGLTYAFSPSTRAYGQLDIPISNDTTTRFTIGIRFGW